MGKYSTSIHIRKIKPGSSEIKSIKPESNRRIIITTSGKQNIYELQKLSDTFCIGDKKGGYGLQFSFDNIERYISDKLCSGGLTKIRFYDAEIRKAEDYEVILKLMKVMNHPKNGHIELILHANNIPLYINALNNCGIDRNFLRRKCSITIFGSLEASTINFLSVEKAMQYSPCDIKVPSFMINRFSLQALKSNLNNISVFFTPYALRDKNDIILLKEFTTEFAEQLNYMYGTGKLTDYEKAKLVYDYIKNNISFDGDAAQWINGKQSLIGGEKSESAALPYSTLINGKGVCGGQAYLMEAMLNNAELKVNCRIVEGSTSIGGHAWTETIINSCTFETCLTMAGFFKDLAEKNYTRKNPKYYMQSNPYPYSNLSPSDIQIINKNLELKRIR